MKKTFEFKLEEYKNSKLKINIKDYDNLTLINLFDYMNDEIYYKYIKYSNISYNDIENILNFSKIKSLEDFQKAFKSYFIIDGNPNIIKYFSSGHIQSKIYVNKEGNYHNEIGPAIILYKNSPNIKILSKQYWYNGNKFSDCKNDSELKKNILRLNLE